MSLFVGLANILVWALNISLILSKYSGFETIPFVQVSKVKSEPQGAHGFWGTRETIGGILLT